MAEFGGKGAMDVLDDPRAKSIVFIFHDCGGDGVDAIGRSARHQANEKLCFQEAAKLGNTLAPDKGASCYLDLLALSVSTTLINTPIHGVRVWSSRFSVGVRVWSSRFSVSGVSNRYETLNPF